MSQANTDKAKIKTYALVDPRIYAYTTPKYPPHDGWIKIGYTEQNVRDRIDQQTNTADIETVLEWDERAEYTDEQGGFFTDKPFHNFLTRYKGIQRKKNKEWFQTTPELSNDYFHEFASRSNPEISVYKEEDYTLRKEQHEAVSVTMDSFSCGGEKFLWNAKPRFGKTLSSYDLIQQMGCQNVLIVSNRPSISNSWLEDFVQFVGWRGQYVFVSDNPAMQGVPGVVTRNEYIEHFVINCDEPRCMIAFESLQGLKGSVHFGGKYDKLKWMTELSFDLLIVDESQEGVDTAKTDEAFGVLNCKHTLYLSGTPFKALAKGCFADNQIYNWSYADEQRAKAEWPDSLEAGQNPYERMPQLLLFTYKMSDIVQSEIDQKYDLTGDGDWVDYAFDLNEFFKTENGKFVHLDDVRRFITTLHTGIKYPFSTPELRGELAHTLWLLDRVDSVKALEKLLREDEVFSEYKIVIAAGDGRAIDEDESVDREFTDSYHRVKDAIKNNEKTITLSVGQLTVGVTVPEWTGCLMLCNMTSPSSYMQAAFRVQNPGTKVVNGAVYRKNHAYVFDFDPARTLIIYDDYANNLRPAAVNGTGTGDDRKQNIREMLNFFPVLGEDECGQMVELDAAQVLSIPRKIKSQEVVRRGFMSNFLFQNIHRVFGNAVAMEIVRQMNSAGNEKFTSRKDKEPEIDPDDLHMNGDGEIDIPPEVAVGLAQNTFGPGIYRTMQMPDPSPAPPAPTPKPDPPKKKDDPAAEWFKNASAGLKEAGKQLNNAAQTNIVDPAAAAYQAKDTGKKRVSKKIKQKINAAINSIIAELERKKNIANVGLKEKQDAAVTEVDLSKAISEYQETLQSAFEQANQDLKKFGEELLETAPIDVIKEFEIQKEQAQKQTLEDEIRSNLRGFARTIPSFIMAYGDDELTLGNFDKYTEPDVFQKVTGITLDQFRFLRDGGPCIDPATGAEAHFDGHLFDETVFDDSIQEFLNKKRALADYFDETQTEDIFDYIPPQRTNQIFTPKWVVKKMVDALEQENPGCFDNPDNTFADLYMKSGLYITEIVKRLYRSEEMKRLFPDDRERLKHIFANQVYGMAPTKIIYLIATNYILDFADDEIKEIALKHFAQEDTAAAAQNGTLEQVVAKHFG